MFGLVGENGLRCLISRYLPLAGKSVYHRVPLISVCVIAALFAITVPLAKLHTSGWEKYLIFGAAVASVLGVAFIVVVPWNEAALFKVWKDAKEARKACIGSPFVGLELLMDGVDLPDRSGAVAMLAFTPAWIYGLFVLLSLRFTTQIAIVVAIVLTLVVAGLFEVGQWREKTR